MDCKAIIFDLDGTLLDTLADIADAANRALSAFGYPVHSHENYKWYVGNGARRLMQRALSPGRQSPEVIDACLEAFIGDYSDNWAVSTRPYPGIIDLINNLTQSDIKMAVVTNKPHQFVHMMMEHYFRMPSFGPILGQQDGIPKKPHPQQALAAAETMEVTSAECIFLGDSAVDMETAVRAGMRPVGAAWGFRPVQELLEAGASKILQHPEELLPML